MNLNAENLPWLPAWTKIDRGRLRRNLQLIRRDLPRHVKLLAVVKDEAYGHGALDVVRIAQEEGAEYFGLSTLEEALAMAGERIGVPDFRFFAVAVSLQRSTGGNLAATLDTLADIVRRRRAARARPRRRPAHPPGARAASRPATPRPRHRRPPTGGRDRAAARAGAPGRRR